ncbi:hypothetical protein QJU43_06485 [Pasteurella atlantica]|uniref:hypothetical protein n=1 Tax=Pasteurellaceae TaxID=712 RepID=UPI00274A1500|nr:hypothetical protein [Pasteurella atlantica]MDP8033804.1 hypothetical protein [Pasteurella atlantica]MDP8035739.1 hypothetical protein [Pasteurella atlantica]MDP8037725.1 hypothetical protein [Pasteurella atlantica]MDP8048039.1 hypothetical protein [Pasteurella atlantica]MDP8050063.1 hypothetical protein [Pasteurella atlantica]
MNNYRYLKDLYSYKEWKSQENRKKQDRREFFSSYGLSIISLITLFAIILGGCIIYVHLTEINAISIFPNLIANKNTFIGVTISGIIFISIMAFIPFLFSIGFRLIRSDIRISILKTENNLYIIFSILSIIFEFIYFSLFKDLDWWYHLLFLIIPIMIVINISSTFVEGKLNINKVISASFMYLFFLFSFIGALFFRLQVGGIDMYFMIIFIIHYIFMIIFFIFPLNVLLYISIFILYIFMVIFIPIYIENILEFNLKYKGISNRILEVLDIKENPERSNWYLLDKRFIENKIFEVVKDKENTSNKLKDKFIKWQAIYIASNYDYYCDHRNNCKSIIGNQSKYSNVLYGYFAWNLGETKVFCPSNILIDKIENDSRKTIQEFMKTNNQHPCLFIKGEYLTPLPGRL